MFSISFLWGSPHFVFKDNIFPTLCVISSMCYLSLDNYNDSRGSLQELISSPKSTLKTIMVLNIYTLSYHGKIGLWYPCIYGFVVPKPLYIKFSLRQRSLNNFNFLHIAKFDIISKFCNPQFINNAYNFFTHASIPIYVSCYTWPILYISHKIKEGFFITNSFSYLQLWNCYLFDILAPVKKIKNRIRTQNMIYICALTLKYYTIFFFITEIFLLLML